MDSESTVKPVPGPRPPLVFRKNKTQLEPWGGADHGSLGSLSVGRVHIDCKFRCSESHWGILGPSATPAGIIYVDLGFNQPNTFRLASATVRISLEEFEEHKEHKEHKMSRAWALRRRGNHSEEASSLGVNEYGPKMLVGTTATRDGKNSYSATPNVGFGGFSIGGIGVNSEKTVSYSSRWILSGHPVAGRHRDGFSRTNYNTLVWDLSENELSAQSQHSNVFHTGFAFTHEARPFYIKVEIVGKLRKILDKIRHHFPPFAHREQGTALSLLQLGHEHGSGKSLDALVSGLAIAMERKNTDAVAVAIPDHTTSYRRAQAGPAADAVITASETESLVVPPANLTQNPARPSLTDGLAAALVVFPAADAPAVESGVTTASSSLAELQRVPIHVAPSEESSKEEDVMIKEAAIVEEAAMVEEKLRRLSEYPTVLLLMHLITLLLDVFSPGRVKIKKD